MKLSPFAMVRTVRRLIEAGVGFVTVQSAGWDMHADGNNPLCGDRLTLWVDVKDGAIADIGFQGDGCAISKASASLMTEAVKGKTLAEARANSLKLDWADFAPPKPALTNGGAAIRVFAEYPLHELVERIDWTPFFRAWELAGNFPAILTDEVVGESASSLYADAQAMLDRIVAEKWLTARGVAGLWACHRHDDPRPRGGVGRYAVRVRRTCRPGRAGPRGTAGRCV